MSSLLEFARRGAWQVPLERLIESTGDGIYGLDLDGRCVFINRAGAQLLGYEPAEVLGRNMHELMHHSRPDGAHYAVEDCPIYRAFREGRSCRLDQDFLWRRDGTGFAAEYSSYPVFEEGRIAGAVVTFVDISERRRAQDALRRAHEELEQRVAERTAELADSNERLRQLSAHLLTVREEERSRIAREIHDELGGTLVALKLELSLLQHESAAVAAQQRAGEMTQLIDRAVTEVGRIITDLRPSVLDHQGLWAALDWQAREFLDASGLAGDVRIEIGPGVAEPDSALAIAAFRIFQEILNNIARHAGAGTVRVRVDADADELRMRVVDDGRGISLQQMRNPRSHGVIGMSERARQFGGRFAIGPATPRGTQVRVWLPLRPAGLEQAS